MKADYARAEPLVASRVVTRAEFDQITDELKTSEAELQRAKQAADEARVLLGYATIHSPLTGVVVDKRVEAGDTVSPGQALATLYEPNRMQLVATVRESLAEHLKVGDEIRARLDALQHECSATIREIVPQAETASRSFTVKVTGPCPPGIYSGMFGRIFIPLSEEEVLVVPHDAVSHVGQLSLVDVVEGNAVRRRSVQLGRELPEGYEVLFCTLRRREGRCAATIDARGAAMNSGNSSGESPLDPAPHDPLSRFIRLFLDSNLSAILIVFSVLVGLAALYVTPREEVPANCRAAGGYLRQLSGPLGE